MPPPTEESQQTCGYLEGARIVVVESHSGVRSARAALLHAEGIVTTGLATIEEALEYVRSGEAPDLLLLDYQLGREGCRQFIETLQTDPRLAAIAVVLLYGGEGRLPNARELGAVGILRKPVDPHLLLELAHEYCD